MSVAIVNNGTRDHGVTAPLLTTYATSVVKNEYVAGQAMLTSGLRKFYYLCRLKRVVLYMFKWMQKRRNFVLAGFLVPPLLLISSLFSSHSTSAHSLDAQTHKPIGQTQLTGLKTRRDFLPIGVAVEKQSVAEKTRATAAQVLCDKSIDLTSQIRGVMHVAAQENGICYNADLDTYSYNGRTFVVQGGGWDAAWTHTDVTDPYHPVMVNQTVWDIRTYTPDIKAFSQNGLPYIAISMERLSSNGYCGIAIYNVADPATPQLQSHIDGVDWCDVHNIFVEDDANGEGSYIYLTADAPHDMRVLDIGGQQGGSVTTPVEIGRYSLPDGTYIHDITVLDHTEASGGAIGRRVYIAYWEHGLVVLNAADVTPGVDPTPVIDGDIISPPGFQVHHAMASPDGSRLFIQDEMLVAPGTEPVQMWDISNPQTPVYVDGLTIGRDVPLSAAHNLEMRWDLHPDRLYVGWYKMGLQAWQYTADGFVRSYPEPLTALLYHQVQTNLEGTAYTGAWGVRLAEINDGLYVFQSDYRYGLIIDCLRCPEPAPATATATSLMPETPWPTATTPYTVTPPTATPIEIVTPVETLTALPVETATPLASPSPGISATVTAGAPSTPNPGEPDATTATALPTDVPGADTATPTPMQTDTAAPAATPTAAIHIPTAAIEPTPTATDAASVAQSILAQQVYNIQIDADENAAISPGDTLSYRVKIQNVMQQAATSVRFHQYLGEYLEVVNGSVRVDNQGALRGQEGDSSRQLDVDIGTLEPGQIVEVTYEAQISQAIPVYINTLELQAMVSADGIAQAMVDNGMTDAPNDSPVLHIVRTVFRALLPIIKR